jgi:Tfp pilus assembly protein FimT
LLSFVAVRPYAAVHGQERGVTILELLFIVTVSGLMTAMSVPAVIAARDRIESASATREVATAIRTARLQAVTMRATFRVRFNCPATRQYRVVQVTGNTAIDNDTNRCAAANYPYPDTNTAAPNGDGPILMLRNSQTFGTGTTDLLATMDGRIAPVTGGSPVSISVVGSRTTSTMSIAASGRIDLPY